MVDRDPCVALVGHELRVNAVSIKGTLHIWKPCKRRLNTVKVARSLTWNITTTSAGETVQHLLASLSSSLC